MICIGTEDGVFRWRPASTERPECLLADVAVRQVRTSATGRSLLAATMDGLYRSRDGGDSWTNLGLPVDGVASVYETPDGRVLFAGTQPAALYRSTDAGETWSRCDAFDRLPGREQWTQLGPGAAQVRDLVGHRAAPGRVYAAVEAEGVFVTTEYGNSWCERSYGLHRDPHGLYAFDAERVLAACGSGLYRTSDGGRHWHRLDTGSDSFWQSYVREACSIDGVLYSSAQDRAEQRFDPPGSGVILTSTDGGRTVTVNDDYADADSDYVNAWANFDGRPVGGTIQGRILLGPPEWERGAEVDAEIRSLVSIPP